MAIVVMLDLSDSVSVHDLWQLLSFVPHWFDKDKDIRAMDAQGLATRWLEIEVSKSEDDVSQP